MLFKRLCDAFVVAIAICVFAANNLHADEYPSRTVRVIVLFAPAGVTDIVTRIVFDAVSSNLGQPMVIENKPVPAAQSRPNLSPTLHPTGILCWSTTPRGRWPPM
jgi:hypothetical protein